MTLALRQVLQTLLDRVCEPGANAETVFGSDEVEIWPKGAADRLVAAQLLEKAPPATRLVCRGCEERCLKQVVADHDDPAAFNIDCHLYADRGPVPVSPERLNRWVSRRKMVARFVARSLGLSLRDADPRWRSVELRHAEGNGVKRLIKLELIGEARLCIGSTKTPLLCCLDWAAVGIAADRQALSELLTMADDVKTGGKSYVPSTVVRDENRVLKAIRDNQLQRRMDRAAADHPRLNKLNLAKLIERERDFEGMKAATIARLTRKPRPGNKKK